MSNSNIYDLLNPNIADEEASTQSSKAKEADALDIMVFYLANSKKLEINVFPENTIRQVLKCIEEKDGKWLTFVNVRTSKETNKLDITMSEFDIRNGDTFMIEDDCYCCCWECISPFVHIQP